MVKVIKTKVEIEGRVHEETVVVDGEEPAPWEEERQFEVVGRPVNRIDGAERVTGAARYTFDIHPSGLLQAAVLRSPHPHAKIVRIDTSGAEALPGVRAVLSSANAPHIKWHGDVSRLFDTEVRFAGEEVAAVAADDLDTTRDALELIEVEYEPLPFLTDMEEAARPGSLQIHPRGNVLKSSNGSEGELYRRGDVNAALKSADVVVEGTFRTSAQLHSSLEPHGSVAAWQGGRAYYLGIDPVPFRSEEPRGRGAGPAAQPGKGYLRVHGRRLRQQGHDPEAICYCSAIGERHGRPVKLMLSRHEEQLITGNRGETIQRYKVGAKRDGTLVAIDLEAMYNLGAYGTWAGPVDGPAQRALQLPQRAYADAGRAHEPGIACCISRSRLRRGHIRPGCGA